MSFLGVPVRILGRDEELETVLENFRPTAFLASDHPAYLGRISWHALSDYRAQHPIRLGLTASIGAYGNIPLKDRLTWAQLNGVDFYFSFRDPEFVRNRPDYEPFFSSGFPMLYLPFGTNIIHNYPVPIFQRDLDYALIVTRSLWYLSTYGSRSSIE